MRRIVIALVLGLLAIGSAQAASTFSGLPAASQPLGNIPDYVPLDQGTGCTTGGSCTTSQSPSLRIGQPIQTNCVTIATPFLYQPCINTSMSPPTLQYWNGSAWGNSFTLSPIPAYTVLGNATGSTAAPTGLTTLPPGLTIPTPVLSGTVTGTYTLGGTPSITAPILSGTITGTYTLGGTPTIDAPILSGTVTGTYTLGGTPSISVSALTGTTLPSSIVTSSLTSVGVLATLEVSGTLNVGLAGYVGQPMVWIDAGSLAGLGIQSNETTLPALATGSNAGFVIQGNYSSGGSEYDFINTVQNGGVNGQGFRFMQMTGAGAERDILYMSGSGNVGIGTLDPATLLDVEHLGYTASSSFVHDVTINRTETLSTSTGTEGAEDAPLYISNVNSYGGTGNNQVNGILGIVTQNGVGDAVAIWAQAQNFNTYGSAPHETYAIFANAIAGSSSLPGSGANAGAVGIGFNVVNETGVNQPYTNYVGSPPYTGGIDLPCGGGSGNLCSVGIAMRYNGAQFDVGDYFGAGSTATADILSESSSTTVLSLPSGSHGIAIDCAGGASFSIGCIRLGSNINAGILIGTDGSTLYRQSSDGSTILETGQGTLQLNPNGFGVTIGAGGLTVGTAGVTTSGVGSVGGLILTAATPASVTGTLTMGTTVVAATNCGSLSGAAGCMEISYGGTLYYVPYYP